MEWQENNYVKLSETDGKINKHFFVFLKTIEPVYISRVYCRPELGPRDSYRDNLTNQLSCLITSKYSVERPICLLLYYYTIALSLFRKQKIYAYPLNDRPEVVSHWLSVGGL